MSNSKPPIKKQLHPRNKHNSGYDFTQLLKATPELAEFIIQTKYGKESIDFFNPKAVIALNKALLKLHYGIDYWEIPDNYLCPPIPGRVDYIHYIADLLSDGKKIPTGPQTKCFDLGIGASCIYPIIGNTEYGWSFIASDIDPKSLAVSQNIIDHNAQLKNKIELRLQKDPKRLLKGVLKQEERIDLLLCNPPFHSSAAQANAAAQKKLKNLKGKKTDKLVLNFGGQQNELWCNGGEYQFIKNLIHESKNFSNNCKWFTSLISKKETLKHMLKELEKINATKVKTIEMNTANKVSRIFCWSFS